MTSVILSQKGEGIFCNSNALHAGYMIDDQDCNYISVTFHPKFIYGYENSILQTKYVDFITSKRILVFTCIKTGNSMAK